MFHTNPQNRDPHPPSKHNLLHIVEFDDDIELDGYSTETSSEDFEDDEDDRSSRGGDFNALAHINIHQRDFSESFLPDVIGMDTEDPFKHTELVIKFQNTIHVKALKWFIQRVTAHKSHGGAELMLRREPYYGEPNESLVVHVTAAGWRLLEVAQKLEIKKMDYSRGLLRPFKMNDLRCFLNDSMEISDILSPAEKQIVVMHELKHLYVHPMEKQVPGYPHIHLATGQSIFHVYTSKRLISSYFALHQEEELNKLEGRWFSAFWAELPYEDIRSYFGDQTCLYFNFVAYYSYWLTIPAIIGIIMRLLPQYLFQYLVFYFCIINMLLVTIFLITWQRFQSRLTYSWGTIRMSHWEEPRDNHYGQLTLDPVTGQLQRKYPYFKCALKTYCGSLPVVLACCGATIWTMYTFLEIETATKVYAKEVAENIDENDVVDYLVWKFAVPAIPVSFYAMLVFIFTKIYRWLASWLTEWENHRTETQHQRHLVHKMIVFEIANSFSVLFYTAFVLNDFKLLQERLFVLLGVVQFLMTIQQCAVPILFRKGQAKMHEFLKFHELKRMFRWSGNPDHVPHLDRPYPGLEDVHMEVLDKRDKRVQMSKIEEMMDPYEYEADFDEYLNLYLQFGYIFLFSSVYTPAAAFAFASNLLVLGTSLFKRREVYQRALARRVGNIAAWLDAFEILGAVAVVTNCALLAVNEPLREAFPDFSELEWILMFALIEHFVLVLQYFVKRICPKIPYKVKVALNKLEYESKMAYNREQAEHTRRRLAQVYHPINSELYLRRQAAQRSAASAATTTSNTSIRHRNGHDNLSNSTIHNVRGGAGTSATNRRHR